MELLVVISIIGVLAALLLPAVQAARNAARQAQCSGNLRQIALAVNGYFDTWSAFPMGEMPGSLSPNVAILPYLEQTALYSDFNFIVLPEAGRGVGGRKPTWMDASASTAVGTRVAVFNCPSEPKAGISGTAPNFWRSNYAWNSGTWWPRSRSWDGLFGRSRREGSTSPVPPDPPLGSVRAADCPDGLSQTLLVAEVASGSVLKGVGRTSISDCYAVPGLNDHMRATEAAAVCAAVDWRTAELPWGGNWRQKGYPGVEGTLWRSWFNTLLPPNQPCCVHGSGGFTTAADWWFMVKPVSSYHGGTVNAALADGSVRSVKATINPTVWQSLGTRAGSETVDAQW